MYNISNMSYTLIKERGTKWNGNMKKEEYTVKTNLAN